MSGRQVAGAAILAAVFFGFFAAYGVLAGWLFAASAFGAAIVLAALVLYAARLLVDG